MTTDAFHAMNMIASLRLTNVERLRLQRQLEELTGILAGPEGWPAVAALDTAFLEDLWGRLDADGPIQDDFVERFDEIFQEWSEVELGQVDTECQPM